MLLIGQTAVGQVVVVEVPRMAPSMADLQAAALMAL
jgi:hypothetical protein